jgi:hypothetical protein
MPYEDTDRLVSRGLIVDLWNQTPLEEPIEEVAVSEEKKLKIEARYIRTYLARLIQADDEVKGNYTTIKNKFLSYKKVKSRLSKKRETFYSGRTTLAKLDVKGKKIDLYLALDPKEFEDKAKYYNFIDVSEKKKDTPMLIKVSGPIKLKRALELIEIIMEKNGIVKLKNYTEQDFYMPYEDTERLVERGLIKDLENQTKEIEEQEITPNENRHISEEQEAEVLEVILGKEEEFVRENEAFYNGEKCVFAPYFEGYKNADAIIIPITKEKFDSLKEGKKTKIFNSAFKKFNKRINKSKKK